MESVLNNLLNGFNDDTNNLLQLNDDVADGYAALAPPASKSAIRFERIFFKFFVLLKDNLIAKL